MEVLGFLLFIAAIALVVVTPLIVLNLGGKVSRLVEQVAKLVGRVDRLASQLDRHEVPPQGISARPEESVRQPAEVPVPPAPLASEPELRPAPALMQPGFVAALHDSPRAAPTPKAPRRAGKKAGVAAAGLETAIGQRWLVRAGALVLVVGIGFLYAYAIERGWIGVTQRAISGAVVGLAVVGLGLLFNRRGFAPLAQGFVACGTGILFLDVFASHRLYQLIGPEVALAAMTLVTGMTVAIALRWSAMPLVILAQLAGYLTPFILEDRMPDRALVTFAYLFVIGAGFLFVAARKRWVPVQILAAAATPVSFLVARALDSSLSHWHVTAWACAFDLLFLAASVAPAVLRREYVGRVAWVVVPAMALAAALVMEDATAASHPVALFFVLSGLALVHVGAAEAVSRRNRVDTDGREIVRLTAAALLVDAVRFGWQVQEHTTFAFAALGALLALGARFRDSNAFRAGAASAFVLAIGRVIVFHLHGADSAVPEPFLNVDFATSILVGMALAAASFLNRGTRWIGLSAASLLLVTAVTGEILVAITNAVADPAYQRALVHVARTVSATGVLVGFASAVGRTGRRIFIAFGLVAGALALMGFGGLVGLLQRPPQPLFALNPICLGTLFVPFGLLAAAWMLRQERPGWIARGLAAIGSVIPLVALSVEAHRFARHAWGSAGLVDAGSAAVSVTWALYAAALLAIGISRRLRAVRLGALLLLGITLVKVVVSDLAQLSELARIASFIALGVVLMAGAWAYHRFAGRIFGDGGRAVGAAR